jgi:fatty acid desaturase
MQPTVDLARPRTLFLRTTVSTSDQRIFVVKLIVVVLLAVAGGYLALLPEPVLAVAGMVLLGAVFTHAVELQHQCLHHSAFIRPRSHRIVGLPLGLPMLVSYSHYRVRHLQHHRYLGTPEDTEFFGFDIRQPLTYQALLRGLFDLPRLAGVTREIARSYAGKWEYGMGQIGDRRKREIINEYRLMGVFLAVMLALMATGFSGPVVRLWLIPLIVATPMHFLVELPEHILCDTDTTDVLRNTRSIRGSWLSTWFTNGNNLHIEHHAAMMVPINRLGERHADVERHAKYVQRSYPSFYRLVLHEAARNSRSAV